MKKRYKVVDTSNSIYAGYGDHYVDAMELRSDYGLYFLSVQDIKNIWEEHSDNFAAGWLYPSKESVESVFGVVLEEIK